MAACVTVSGSALVVSSVPIGSCVDYVITTASEFAASSPALPLSDVVILAGGVVLTWVIAFSFRVLRRAL